MKTLIESTLVSTLTLCMFACGGEPLDGVPLEREQAATMPETGSLEQGLSNRELFDFHLMCPRGRYEQEPLNGAGHQNAAVCYTGLDFARGLSRAGATLCNGDDPRDSRKIRAHLFFGAKEEVAIAVGLGRKSDTEVYCLAVDETADGKPGDYVECDGALTTFVYATSWRRSAVEGRSLEDLKAQIGAYLRTSSGERNLRKGISAVRGSCD